LQDKVLAVEPDLLDKILGVACPWIVKFIRSQLARFGILAGHKVLTVVACAFLGVGIGPFYNGYVLSRQPQRKRCSRGGSFPTAPEMPALRPRILSGH
jgi:hypothetical protein